MQRNSSHLWKTNYIAYDLAYEGGKYSNQYTDDEKASFIGYMEKKLESVEPELDRNELRKIFIDIYANPVKAKEDANFL